MTYARAFVSHGTFLPDIDLRIEKSCPQFLQWFLPYLPGLQMLVNCSKNVGT